MDVRAPSNLGGRVPELKQVRAGVPLVYAG